MPPQLLMKNILWRLMSDLSKTFGQRLAKLKQSGAFLLEDGTIAWRSLVYKLEVKDDIVVQVQHVASAAVVDIAKFGLSTTGVTVQYPWSDHLAQLARPPMASAKLMTFFGNKVGPNALCDPNKPKQMQTLLQNVTGAIALAKAEQDGTANKCSETTQLARELAEKKGNEKKERMKALREKAQEQMKQKRARAEFSIPSAAPEVLGVPA